MKAASKYSKIIKWVFLGLLVIGVVDFLFGWIYGFEKNNSLAVDLLFYWTYAMVAVALVSIIFIGGAIGIKNDKKFLVKVLCVVGGAAAICVVVYLLSPGAPAVGIAEQPEQGTLKLTDTILNLTYLAGAAAILAIIAGEIIASVRNKKSAKK